MMELTGYEHLHLHSTEGSLLDGHGFVEDYAAKWKSHGDYLSVSDHGMMSAIPSLIKSCMPTNKKDDVNKNKKLTPIFSMEAYVNPLQIEYDTEKQLKDYIKSLNPEEQKKLRTSYHLLAIAYNDIGYENLVTLSSLAWTKGHYYRPRVNHKQLVKYKEGIIFTSCCYASEIAQAFDAGGDEAGFAMIEKYMAMFGENFYLELILLDFVKQKPYNAFIIRAHNKYKVPLIISCDTHYVNAKDSRYQQLMLMVQTKRTIKDIEKRIQESGGQDLFELQDTNLWMKREEEINAKWQSDYRDIIDYELFKQAKLNTVEICRKASGISLDRSMKFPIIENANEILQKEMTEGFKRRKLSFYSKEYTHRLKEEYNLICRKGFASYCLMVKAITDEACRVFSELLGWGNGADALSPGRGCLSGDTCVVMADGTSKKLQCVNIGDKVVTYDGTIKKVINKFVYPINEELLCVKTYYGDNRGVKLTKDHHVLRGEPELKWTEASNLKVGDWLFIPKPVVDFKQFSVFDLSQLNHNKSVLTYDDNFVYQGKLNPLTKRVKPIRKLPRFLNLTADFYKLLGLFTGDGWIVSCDSKTEVGFAFHSDDTLGCNFLEKTILQLGLKVKFIKSKTRKLIQGIIHSRHLKLFIQHCFPGYKYTSHTKHVPSFVFEQSNECKIAFLRGYFSADGHDGQHKCSFSTVSEDLANQVRFLCWQLGIPASLRFDNRVDKRNGRKSVEIIINVPHCQEISESDAERFYNVQQVSNGMLVKIRSISVLNSVKDVYDIQVEDNHDYLTTSFQVHNSAVGSLLFYCLGVTDVDPIQHDLLFSRFISEARDDMPDVDLDISAPIVRDYLKNEWAPKKYGTDYVCNIGTYNTFGIKNALVNMTRVFDKDRKEILDITTKIGLKDDEGKTLSWDKAMELYPPLKKYAEENPDIADAAKNLLHRSNSAGKHAGGLIISSKPLNKFIPLVKDKDNMPMSAWPEGLHSQDLGPMGLIKFDILVVTGLLQSAYTAKLVKERHNIDSICALPGQKDWSDISYLNNTKATKMAKEGDLKCIFQFDSEGIIQLAKKMKADTFDDLVALTSIYRPGPMMSGFHESYVKRKHKQEKYEIHPLLESVLRKTYGLMIFQETIMQVLNKVGEIPLKDCEKVRKAISKKKIEGFLEYKDKFIENGAKNLGIDKEKVEEIWKQIEFFSEYSFNKCITGDSVLMQAETGKLFTIEEIYKNKIEFNIHSLNEVNNKLEINRVSDVIFNGIRDVFEIQTNLGKTIKATDNHKFLAFNGWKKLSELKIGDKIASPCINALDIFWDEIKSIQYIGEEKTYDLTVENNHNFAVNGFIAANSHSTAYTFLSWRLLYFKANFPLEFYTATLYFEDDSDTIKAYKIEAERHGITLCPLDLNKSGVKFQIVDDKIYFGFSNVKGIGEDIAKKIVENQPYISFVDFLNRFGTDESVVKPLIALRMFNDAEPEKLYRYYQFYKDAKNKLKSKRLCFEKSCARYKEQGDEVKLNKRINSYKEEEVMSLDNFESNEPIDEKILLYFQSLEEAETKFYGFLWHHPLLKSPNYEGNQTFDVFKAKGLSVGYVEMLLKSVTRQVSKKKKEVVFWVLKVEDANGEETTVQVWEDDWERFQDDLKVGQLVKMQLKAPDAGFYRYTLNSPLKWKRYTLPKSKDNDFRVIILEKPSI